MSVARNDRLSACSGGKHGEDTAPGADVESANGFSASVNSINLSAMASAYAATERVAQHVEMILWKTGISLGKVVVFSILYTELNAHGVVRARKWKNHAVFNLYFTGHKLHGSAIEDGDSLSPVSSIFVCHRSESCRTKTRWR